MPELPKFWTYVRFPLDQVLAWMKWVARPDLFCDQLLDPQSTEKSRWNLMLDAWITAFLITVLTEVAALVLVDGDLQKFTVMIIFLGFTAVVGGGTTLLIVQAGLRMNGLRIKLSDLAAIHTCFVTVPMPVYAMLDIPRRIAALERATAAKIAGHDLGTTLTGSSDLTMFTVPWYGPYEAYKPVVAAATGVSCFIMLAFYARALSKHCNVERHRALSALVPSALVAGVVVLASGILEPFSNFASVSSKDGSIAAGKQ